MKDTKYRATVKWFNRPLGYGFAEVKGLEGDVAIHFSAIKMDGYRFVNEKDIVTIVGVEETDKGYRALSVIPPSPIQAQVPECDSEDHAMMMVNEYGVECDLNTHNGCVDYYGISYLEGNK